MRTRRLELRRHRTKKGSATDEETDPDDVPQYFQVTVTVIEARKLVWTKPQSAASYVIVLLEKKKQRTGVRRNMEDPYYGESFAFELHTSTREMQRAALCVAVMEARCPPRLVGEASVELGSVWTQPHHTVSHKWAQLAPRDPAVGPTGYLKVDISILFKGRLNSPIPYEEKIEDNLLLPSGSEQQRACYQLVVYGAYGLPSSAHCHSDKNGKPPSTFVRVTFSGLVAKTSVQSRCHNPMFCEQLSLVEMFPNICETIRLEVCSADGFTNRALASTHLTLTQISHCVENGFLPTFGPSLLHMYGSWSCGSLSVGDDGPYHRGALLVALKTVVPYSKHHLRTVSVQPVPPLKLDTLWALEEFCVYCSIFEVSMLDSRLASKCCGVAITMGEVSVGDRGDAEFIDLVRTIKQSRLHYTGSMNIYNSSPALGYLEFSNEFPVLQLATSLPDFRFRVYRNNMVYGIVADLEKGLGNVEGRLRCHDYEHPSELVDQLSVTMMEASTKILKFLDMALHSMFEDCSATELDNKQMRLQKEDIEKIYQRLSKKSKATSASLLGGSGICCTTVDTSKRGVKTLLAHCRMVLQDLNCLIFKTSVGWPDIVLWMLCSGSRVAYAKIAPADLIYSVVPEQRGRTYGQVHTVYLKSVKCPKHLTADVHCDCIAAKVELLAWLGAHRQRSFFEASLPAGFKLKTKEASMYIKCMPLVVECRVYIYRAKLFVGDQNKAMTPSVRVNFMGGVKETQTEQRSVSPMWNEVIKINRNIYSTPQRLIKNPPEVLVEIYDKDDENRKGFLGRVTLVPRAGCECADCPPVLQWLELFKGTEQTGRILMSAQLIQMPEQLVKTTYYCPAGKSTHGPGLQEYPPTPERLPNCLVPVPASYKVDVYWWGLRDVSIAHKPRAVLELDELTVESRIVRGAEGSCNFPDGRTSQLYEGDLSESLCSPLSVKIFDSSTFGRTLFVGLNVVRNPLKYMVDWIPKHEREESLYSTSIISAGFVQVNHMLFVKRSIRSYSDQENLSFCSSKDHLTAKVSFWRRIFSRKEVDEEQYTLLPVFNKKDPAKVVKNCPEEKDWWMRYTSSLKGYEDDENTGDDRFEIYSGELEVQPGFSKFKDWCSTLKIYNGKKTGIPDKDDQLQCGYLKVGLVIYKWPPPQDTVAVSPNGVELARGYFADHPDNEPAKFLVRVYVVRAFALARGCGKAQPYVAVQCGRKTLGDRATGDDPVFGRMYEFRCCLPEDYELRVSLLEGDGSPPEDLIGRTTIDLEDRVYTKHRACVGLANEYHPTGSAKWRDVQKPSAILEELCLRNHLPPPVYPDSSTVLVNAVEYRDFEHAGKYTSTSERKESICLSLLHKWHTLPICGHKLVPEHVETRTLYNPDRPAEEQGKIHLWVDIFPLDCGLVPPPVNITPRPMEEFELRVVVWDVRGVRLREDKACDIYVKGWIGPSDEAQDTDIHYRSQKGEGCFNWRMVFHFHYQHTEGKLVLHEKGPFTEVVEHFPPILVVQVQDSQAVSPEDFLGTATLDLTCLPRGALAGKTRAVNLFAASGARAWYPLRTLEHGRYQAGGMIDLELQLLPKEKAVLMPVGLGREPPSPLPKPKRSNPICYKCYSLSPKYRLSRVLKICVLVCMCIVLLCSLLSLTLDDMHLRASVLNFVFGPLEYNGLDHHTEYRGSSGHHRIRRATGSSLLKVENQDT